VRAEKLKQAQAYEQTAFDWMLEAATITALKQLEREAKAGPLNKWQIKMLRLFASEGCAKAREILDKLTGQEKSKNNLPLVPDEAAKSFRSDAGVAGNSAKTFPRVRVEFIKEDSAK
jgi:hypothetical protein